jgi:hypothetical protein
VWAQRGGWEQWDDEPLYLVIGRETADNACARMGARFGLDIGALLHFRDAARAALA